MLTEMEPKELTTICTGTNNTRSIVTGKILAIGRQHSALQMIPVATDILLRHGIQYDSSIFRWFHDHLWYYTAFSSAFPLENGLLEFLKLRWKFSSVFPAARLLLQALRIHHKNLLAGINSKGSHLCFTYTVEIDLINQKNLCRNWFHPHYINLDKTYGRLERLIKISGLHQQKRCLLWTMN